MLNKIAVRSAAVSSEKSVAYYVRRLIDSADSINCDRIGRFFVGFSLGLVLGVEPLSVPHLPVDLHINIPDDFELIDVLI